MREALGRILAVDVESADPVPGFDNSSMDGFAVRAEDTRGAAPGGPVILTVGDESRAGRPALSPLHRGEAIGISTGAVIPDGADSVVRIEDTSVRDGRVEIEAEVKPGTNVRHAGDDIEPGATVLRHGVRIGAAELGVLASVGAASVSCIRRPRLAVLTTGDELLEPGAPGKPGGVRNSNAYTIPALALSAGAEPVATETVRDDPELTSAAIERMLDAELVVVCGGVSVGGHDHVKEAFASLGVERVFWRVALKPGKPTWFGTRDGRLVFGLPGNPVSAMVTFILLVAPSLRALLGASPVRHTAHAALACDYRKPAGRAHALRCHLHADSDRLSAAPSGSQGSHVLSSMLDADALAIIPAACEHLAAGERIELELLDGQVAPA